MGTGYLLILCGLFLPVLIGELRDKENGSRILAVSSAVFLGVCVFMIFTVDVQFGVLTLAVLVIWTLIRFLPKKLRLPALLLLLALVLVLAWALPFGEDGALHELHEVLHGHLEASYGSGRVGVWTYCVRLLQGGDRLLTGTGPDTFTRRFNTFLHQYYADHPDLPAEEKLIEYFDNPHNEYLAQLINCGIPAMLAFLFLVLGGCFGRVPWRDSVLCYGVQALLSFSVCIVAPMFWMVLGLAWSGPPEKTSH